MKNVVIEKEGQKYKWTVKGLNEAACVSDIENNHRVKLTDYVATMFADRYGCVAEVREVREMTHNQYVEFLKANASRMYSEKGYTMADYQQDADSVEIVGFDLDKFGLPEDAKKIINSAFASDTVNRNGNMLIQGHYHNDSLVSSVAAALECESVHIGGYNGFYKNDERMCVLEFCEGDLYLVLCETVEDYHKELDSYYNFYEIEPENERVFKEGSYNLFIDGVFEAKAYNEKEVDAFVLYIAKEYPESSIKVTRDWKNGYNDSFIDVTSSVLGRLNEQLLALEEVCIEVCFDGQHVDNVYAPRGKAAEMIISLAQHGYDEYNGDVKEDWMRSGGRENPVLSFKVVECEQKSIDSAISAARERAKLLNKDGTEEKGFSELKMDN